MSRLVQIAAAVAATLLGGGAAAAGPRPLLHFPDPASEISAASRVLGGFGIITSTYRTAAHNKAVGGVPNSYHLLYRAIDIARRPGVTHQQIEAALKRAGFNLVESLDERDHSHFAFAAVALPASALPAPGVPPAAVSPPLPRVAADEHGTLSIDLAAQAARAASGTTSEQAK